MSITQKMFACSGFTLVVILAVFARAVPVPMPEERQPVEYRQFVSARAMAESADEPTVLSVHRAVQVDPAVVRPVRSASPFLGIFGGYERPYKAQQHYHHHHQEEHEYEHEYEPEHHHRPHYHKPQYHHHHQRPQQHGGGGAGSFASAGSFSGGHGGGNSHSQSGANSQSASFGFGPFQASYSASSAHSGSHSDREFSDY